MWCFTAHAEENRTVTSVDVRGLVTVAKETCIARVQTKPGNPYRDDVVSEDIRRLYALGYFTDVRVQTEPLSSGLLVVFIVKEKPVIDLVDIQGARRIRHDKALQLIGVAKGQLYDPRRLKEGVDALKAEYQRKGYSRVEIASAVSPNEAANTVAIGVVVDEGPRMRIRGVFVDGNPAFSDKRIRKVMKTKTRWLFASIYDEKIVNEDVERVKAFYRKNGYQDVAVASRVLADPSGRGLYAHLSIVEGMQYRVGQVDMTGPQKYPKQAVLQVLRLKPGAVYSQEALQEDLRAIKQFYGDRAYINAQITPSTTIQEPTKIVDVVYAVDERELTYVDRIEIHGNLHTMDKVIRRELRIYPGEPFYGTKIRKSLDRLYNLGYFEEVNVDSKPTARSNAEDLILDVKESKTGSFSFGGGFSSIDKLVGLVELEQRNFDWRNWKTFTGAGQDLRAKIEIGSVRRYLDLSFTEPWLFDQPISFGIDLFNRTRLRSRNLGLAFEEQQRGVGLRLGKELTDAFRVDTSYKLYREEISDVVDDASADLRAEQGRNLISVIGGALSWDERNSRIDPTSGWYTFISSDLAGLGGDKNFYRFQAGASAYLPHWDRYVLENRVRAGVVRPYSDTEKVPIFERFYAGGSNTIRGFRERRVGPRDPVSNDPIGGEATFLATIEEVYTVMQDERGKAILKSSVFFDAGNVWAKTGDFFSTLEAGTGVGMRVNTPIGPVRLDLGFPITKLEENDERRPRLHFNISRSF